MATLELKNPLTGQRVEDARRQYNEDRDPSEPILFLPFNKGCGGAAGNPPDPGDRTYRTVYLWAEVLQRDSLLDLLARFIHLQIDEKRDDQGPTVKTESMIFPRYHQLEAVRTLASAARGEGVGHNYLVEHSAGSGKSNTIGWLTHRLASLHDAANERVRCGMFVAQVVGRSMEPTIPDGAYCLYRGAYRGLDDGERCGTRLGEGR